MLRYKIMLQAQLDLVTMRSVDTLPGCFLATASIRPARWEGSFCLSLITKEK